MADKSIGAFSERLQRNDGALSSRCSANGVEPLANGGMLGHAQVVVAAPDDDGTLSIIRQLRHWVLAADPAQGGEGAVLIGGLQ